MCRVCPRAWECQAVRALGANLTLATNIRWPSLRGWATGSSHTSPVNCSGGFFVVGGRESICTSVLLLRPGDLAAERLEGDGALVSSLFFFERCVALRMGFQVLFGCA